MKYTQKELCLIWLDSFVGLEYKHKKQLYEYLGENDGIKELLNSGKDYLVSELGENLYNTVYGSANKFYLDSILDGLNKRQITCITLESKIYPPQLLNTDIPPLVLYAKGDVSLLNTEIFGVVGSRKSLTSQLNVAKDICKDLVSSGFTLITGIAEGVDKTVITTALENNGKIISVLASGFDNLYPSAHAGLIERVIEKGLVITEHLPEIQAKPYFFPVRNRIIAGLSSGVLVVSGNTKSGTLYTAEYAEEYGRHLFAVPYSPNVESGKGCNMLIKQGAILTESSSDILEFFGKTIDKQTVHLTKEQEVIVQAIKDGKNHVEQIAKQLNIPVYQLLPLLSELEIKGVIVKNGTNLYGL